MEIGDRGFMEDGKLCEVVGFLIMSMQVQEVNTSTDKAFGTRYSVCSLKPLVVDKSSEPSVRLTTKEVAMMIYHALGEPLDHLTGGEHYLQVDDDDSRTRSSGTRLTFQIGGQEFEVLVKPPRCSECDCEGRCASGCLMAGTHSVNESGS